MTRSRMPATPLSSLNLWFSFNYGPIHFVVMSTEHNFTVGSAQYRFILNDLSSVDRSVTPWIIFSGHRPIYSSTTDGKTVLGEMMRETYEPLFVKYNVNLCLWGHVHNYERTCGVINYECAASDDDAPVHVIIGMGGNTYCVPWEGTPENDSHGHGHQPEPDWSVYRSSTFGYTQLYANASHLHFTYHTNPRNQIHDEFWLHSK